MKLYIEIYLLGVKGWESNTIEDCGNCLEFRNLSETRD